MNYPKKEKLSYQVGNSNLQSSNNRHIAIQFKVNIKLTTNIYTSQKHDNLLIYHKFYIYKYINL